MVVDRSCGRFFLWREYLHIAGDRIQDVNAAFCVDCTVERADAVVRTLRGISKPRWSGNHAFEFTLRRKNFYARQTFFKRDYSPVRQDFDVAWIAAATE